MSSRSRSRSRGRVVTRKIEDLKIKCYVRKELDQDHVLHLAELLEDGVNLDPIQITKGNIVVAGRHRIEAHLLVDRETIRCELVQVSDEVEMISMAFKENAGGPLPPKRQDIEHTVAMLLDRNVAMKNIGDILGLPAGLTRRYCQEVKSRVSRAKMQHARGAVAGGMSPTKAAEKFGVKLDTLRAHVSGRKRRRQNAVAEIKATLTKTYRGLGQKNANACRKVIDQFQDGDLTEKQAREVIGKVKLLLVKSTRSVEDWEGRFEALVSTTDLETES